MIELLVSVAILATITTIVFVSFDTVTRTVAQARDNADRLRFRQYIWRSFSENIASIYTDASCEQSVYAFEGVDEEGPFGPADTMRFVTALPMPGAASLPGVLRTVEYTVVEPTEEESGDQFDIDQTLEAEGPQVMLEIRETPLVLDETAMEVNADAMNEMARVRHIPVRSVDVTYYDVEEEDWVDEWDCLDKGVLPWAAHIKVNLARSEEELEAQYEQGIDPDEDPDLDMMFAIPLGAGVEDTFVDYNHVSAKGLDDLDADSIFNDTRERNRRRENDN